MKNLALLESFIALFDTVLAAMWVAMGCVVAVHALPPEQVADSTLTPPSFDVAVPVPQEMQAMATLVAARH